MEKECDRWICPEELCKCVCLTFRKYSSFECPNCKRDMIELVNFEYDNFYSDNT